MAAASHSMKWDLTLFAGLTISALALELTIPHTQVGRELAEASHRWFQSGLTPANVPVTLVDISDLENGPTGASRRELEDLLRAVAGQAPKAIGLDIDFSPEELGHVDPVDPQFFQLCLSLRKRVPIFLGVGRTVGGKAADWLGAPEYQEMAAAVQIPKDTRKLLYSIRVGDEPTELRSLSAALAQAYGVTSTGGFVNWLANLGLIERRSRRELDKDVFVEEFPANYSSIGSFLTFRTKSKDFISDPAMTPFIRGRVVIVGAVAEALDKFNIAGKENPYAGVELHASGAVTLISRPLFDVTHFGRVVLTIVLMIATFIPVFAVRIWARARSHHPTLVEHLHGTLIIVYTIGLAIGFGFLMRSTDIVWDGFFLAFFALALHRPVEDVVAWILKSRDRTRSAAAVLLFVVSGVTASAQEVGQVIEFRGDVSYQRPGESATRLVARRNVLDKIFVGDRLKCEPGGWAKLLIGDTTKQLTPSSGWFTVPALKKVVSAKVREAIDQAFRIGAVPRAVVLPGALRVLAPAQKSNAVLRTLMLRWQPGANDCPITASVEDTHGSRIWRESGIPALAGRLDSDALRTALRTADGPFHLQLADACKNETSVTFDVLASEDVALLRSDLEAWDEEVADPFVRHLCRAAVYSQHRLFLEVADEYEAALALAPDSAALLARTIEAYDLTGDVQRRNELEARLPTNH